MSTQKIDRWLANYTATILSLLVLSLMIYTVITGWPITPQLVIGTGLTSLTLIGSLLGGKPREAVAWMWIAFGILSFPVQITLLYMGLSKDVTNVIIIPLGFWFLAYVIALPYYPGFGDVTPGLNPMAERLVVWILGQVSYWTERVSRSLYYQLAKLMPQASVETVILRLNEDKVRVLLLLRPADDPFHASEWAIPGGVVTNTDDSQTFTEPLTRIRNEIGAEFVQMPIFIGITNSRTPRGRVVGLVHLIQPAGEPTHGTWFSVDHLPELGPGPGKLVRHHLKNIQLAAEYFRKHKTSGGENEL